jgi:hypothetical protein
VHAPPPAHWTSPTGQVHTPFVQVSPAAQTLVQLPQWPGSVATLTQPIVGPQLTWPVPHVHTLFTHVDPCGQALPHWPQFALSLDTFTQPRAVPQ